MKRINYYLAIVAFIMGFFLNDTLISQAAEPVPEESNFTNLIIFAKFSGEDEFIDTTYEGTSVRKITDNSYNTAHYNVADYFQTASSGKLRMSSVYLFDGGHSLTLSHSRAYYAKYSEDNPEGYQDASEQNARLYELKEDWSKAVMEAIAAGNRISDYDGSKQYSYEELDKNGDGIIDAITIIYKNTTQTNISVDWSSPLWDYQDYTGLVTIDTGTRTLKSANYVQLTNSYEKSPGDSSGYLYKDMDGNTIVSIGKVVHETAHILGLKDLYNPSSQSPVYFMSVMGKPISPVPQLMSVKEQEALGWAGDENIPRLRTDGEYTLTALGCKDSTAIIGYKMDIPEKNKTLYLEYRDFTGNGNSYDSQTKELNKTDGTRADGINLQSGLVCYLIDTDTKFPSNMNYSGPRWNYEVLGGTYGTKTDAAVKVGEDIAITGQISILVTGIADHKLTFHITGISGEHVHTGGEATCSAKAICAVCHQEYGEINPENHKNTELRGAKEATSTETGYTGDLYCKDCKKKLQTGTVIPKVAPSIIEGKDARIDAAANEAAVFRSNASLEDFVRVEVDGKELTRDTDYTVKEGSTIISLMPQFLKTLTPGNHTVEIVSATGTAKTDFTVISKPTPTPSTKPTEPPTTTATPTPTKQPATIAPASTKEPTGTTGSSSTEKTAETVTAAPAATATPVVRTTPSAVKTDAGATKTTSVTASETTEPQPTESPESTVSDSKESEQQDTGDIVIGPKQEDAQTSAESEEQAETGEENTGWIIGVIALCGVIIAGTIAWILWRKNGEDRE